MFCLYFADEVSPDVLFNPQGYLLLSSKDEVELMEHDHKTQTLVLSLVSFAFTVYGICLY